MKVITMESSVFQTLTEQIAEIAAYVRKSDNGKRREAPDRLVGTEEAARLLNVSKRTLQRMRDENRIEFAVFRGKCQYRLSTINRLIDESIIKDEESGLDGLKHNYSLRVRRNKK